MPHTDIPESFPAMLRRVLGARLRPGPETFPDMFASDGVLDYPFAPPGLLTPLDGRQAIVANFERLRWLFRIDEVFDVAELATSDPDLVVLQFQGRGEGLLTGETYRQRYISVIRLREGEIVLYEDYWNPIEFARAVKGAAAVEAATIE